MTSARISVALATHNGARFIKPQLESILSQSLMPHEIVVSDDASTDETLTLIAETVEKHHAHGGDPVELRVLHNHVALGVTRNFEQAILATTGDLVVLCDQDDAWHPTRLERVSSEFSRRPSLLLLHEDARLVGADDEVLGASLFDAIEMSNHERRLVHGGDAFRAYLGRNLATGATITLRRRLLAVAAPFPPSWVHDEWLAIIASAVGEVDLLEGARLDYRQHGANEIGAKKLSLKGKVGRLLEPREARNSRLLANAEVLSTRLAHLAPPVDAHILRLAEGKLAHERTRQRLPAFRLARVAPVFRALRTGSYATFGRGVADAARDLIQPAR